MEFIYIYVIFIYLLLALMLLIVTPNSYIVSLDFIKQIFLTLYADQVRQI